MTHREEIQGLWERLERLVVDMHEEFRALEKETAAIPLLAARLDELVQELKGNGQPGRLAVMEALLNAHDKLAVGLPAQQERLAAAEKRLSSLDRFRWMVLGAIALAGSGFGIWLLGRLF